MTVTSTSCELPQPSLVDIHGPSPEFCWWTVSIPIVGLIVFSLLAGRVKDQERND